MVDDLRRSLDTKGRFIHRHFIMSPSVINVCRDEDLLDEDDVRALADLEENENRINLLLEMIRSRGYEFYRKFLHVLRKSGHNFLADKLDPIVEKKRVTFNPIPPVQQVTSESSDRSSSSSSSSSDSDSSDDPRRRRKRKKYKKTAKQQEPQKDGILKDIPNLRLPKPIPSNSPRYGQGQGHAQAATALDNLYLHYDTAKVSYRRSLDHLRHEEQHLRASLIVNKHGQRSCRRNLGMIGSIKRQIAFVNDKQSIMKKSDNTTNDEDTIVELIQQSEADVDYDKETWTTVRGKDLPIQKWKY